MECSSSIRRNIFLILAGLLPLSGVAQVNVDFLHSFGVTDSVGRIVTAPMVRATDGRFYGATTSGAGTNVGGSIFRLDTNGANPQVVVRFSDIAASSTTQHRMVYGSDGAIYAFYHTVGSSVDGGLVKVQSDGSSFQILLTAAAAKTRTWDQLMEASDGRLYAIADAKIVRVNRDGTGFESIHTNQTSSFGPGVPTLLFEGNDGMLYVTDRSGGDSSRGVIYKLNTDGTGKTVLLDFNTLPPGTFNPQQLIQGSDDALYGVAVSDNSPVFRVNSDGTGYTVLASLPIFPFNDPGGSGQEGRGVSSLFEGKDGFIYGATDNGATNRAGMVFRVGKDGSGFTNLMAFPVSYFFFDAGAGVNRSSGKFLVEGLDGRIHGSIMGNAVFRFNLDGSGFDTTYTFPVPLDEGTNVASTLALDIEGTLYGTAHNGGAGNHGTVFKLKTDGTSFTALRDFSNNTQDGSEPISGVIVGRDGKLYGACYSGGTGGIGTVFQMDNDGGNYQVLRTFVTTGGDGRFPAAGLLEASDSALYGTTYFGGGGAVGSIFKLSKDGSGYSIIHRFTNNVSGANPSARLVEGSDGRLYGTAETNGPADQGVVFALAKDGIGFTLLHSFSSVGSSLRKPQGALIQGSDNTLYGTTSAGGAAGFGGVFKVKPDASGFSVVREFSATGGDGRAPVAGLTFGADGMLYGVTQFGGGAVNGSVFRLNTDGTGYEKLRAFTGINGDGGNPLGALVQGPDGTLYGTTSAGGGSNFGTVFRITFGGVASRLSLASTSAGGFEIFWPQSATGYRLQTNPDLSNPTGWQAVPDPPILTNSNFTLPITPSNSAAFYRLIKP